MQIKKTITIILSLLFAIQTYSQWNWPIITFDDSTYLNYIIIDTVSNINNIWQVGPPDKTNFTQALSLPNAIITDTTQPYPINDTSVFYIRYITAPNPGGGGWTGTSLFFYYKIDTDEDFDFGKIDFSPDNGQLWIDYLNDTLYNNCYFLFCDPLFTGTNEEWTYFEILNYPDCFNISEGDTIWYRFTFISDGIQSEKDGWIIDDIVLNGMYEGIEEPGNGTISLSVYPNPVKECEITFEFDNTEHHRNMEIKCYDLLGDLVHSEKVYRHQGMSRVSTAGWPSGMYVAIIYSNGGAVGKCKFLVER